MDQMAATSDRDYDRVERAIRYIAANRLEQPSLDEVADAMGLSPFHAQRMFSRWAGLSPKRFLGSAYRRAREVPAALLRECAGCRVRGRAVGRVTPARPVLELRSDHARRIQVPGCGATASLGCA